MKKKYSLLIIGLAIITALTIGATSTFAQEKSDSRPSLIQKIAQKFGLKEADVQAVFDEAKAERKTHTRTRFEERLNQAVANGKITEAQKQAILKKQEELAANKETMRKEFKNMTPEERKQAREKAKAEYEAWAKENGIDLKKFSGIFMHHGWGKGKLMR